MNENANPEAPDKASERSAKPRTRSPAYPAVGLQVALDKAKAIWSHEKRNPASMAALASDWGMNVKSSGFLLAVSALGKYGLLEEVEGAKERSLKLTDTALNLILNEQEDSPERVALLKRCALTPKIHAALWRQFNGDLPSDANLRRQLIVEWDFNPSAVDAFIKDFRHTIEFAKLSPSDKIEPLFPEKGEEENKGVLPVLRRKPAAAKDAISSVFQDWLYSTASQPSGMFRDINPASSVLREFNFPLSVGVATLKLPVPLTEEDFDSLLKMLNTFKDGLIKKPDPVSLECGEGWVEKAKALAGLGVEFNLTKFDYSFDIVNAKQLASETGFDLKLDLNKGVAFFRKPTI